VQKQGCIKVLTTQKIYIKRETGQKRRRGPNQNSLKKMKTYRKVDQFCFLQKIPLQTKVYFSKIQNKIRIGQSLQGNQPLDCLL